MCSDWESNRQPSGLWDDALPTEPHRSGIFLSFSNRSLAVTRATSLGLSPGGPAGGSSHRLHLPGRPGQGAQHEATAGPGQTWVEVPGWGTLCTQGIFNSSGGDAADFEGGLAVGGGEAPGAWLLLLSLGP